MVHSIDIRTEHEAAMASLSPEQRRALSRLSRARQATHFNGRAPKDNLQAIFEAEANARSGSQAA